MLVKVISGTGYARDFVAECTGDLSVGSSVSIDNMILRVVSQVSEGVWKLANPNMIMVVEESNG